MLRLVVNIAMKWRILEEVAVLVLIDGAIHNNPWYIQIMFFHVGICLSSVDSFPTHVLTILAHVVMIPSLVQTFPAYAVILVEKLCPQ